MNQIKTRSKFDEKQIDLTINNVNNINNIKNGSYNDDEQEEQEEQEGEDRIIYELEEDPDPINDSYCWICHYHGEFICCDNCPRVYHLNCLQNIKIQIDINNINNHQWICFECQSLKEEDEQKYWSTKMSADQFYLMLEHSISNRLKYNGSDPFHSDVDVNKFSDYRKYVKMPMSLDGILLKIKQRLYLSFEGVIQDTKLIIHNCITYNGHSSKLTKVAKGLLKMLIYEINEMIICPDCYINSARRVDSFWFAEPCVFNSFYFCFLLFYLRTKVERL
jgi:hypothetical protein